jgi:hypothetical protein
MAISRELILEPADIRRISIQCACGAEAVFTLKKHAEIPSECPSCHKRWNEAFSALVSLCDIMDELEKHGLRFRVPDPESKLNPNKPAAKGE